MPQTLEGLEESKKKLLFLLGETMYRLINSQAIRVLYTSESVDKEKEVAKLCRLINHLQNRVKKVEELYKD
ncbi:MAG: hypothetical protein HQL27_00115 [Candidatus Omnitrophica bacterium]|nr:hypothetical protein [Candidatus Omnitrophota bacterium]